MGVHLSLRALWEGFWGDNACRSLTANRTREIRPSGMRGGLTETWSYGGTRNPLHTPKGCRTETLCLRLRAPDLLPDEGELSAFLRCQTKRWCRSDLREVPDLTHGLARRESQLTAASAMRRLPRHLFHLCMLPPHISGSAPREHRLTVGEAGRMVPVRRLGLGLRQSHTARDCHAWPALRDRLRSAARPFSPPLLRQ